MSAVETKYKRNNFDPVTFVRESKMFHGVTKLEKKNLYLSNVKSKKIDFKYKKLKVKVKEVTLVFLRPTKFMVNPNFQFNLMLRFATYNFLLYFFLIFFIITKT